MPHHIFHQVCNIPSADFIELVDRYNFHFYSIASVPGIANQMTLSLLQVVHSFK